MREALKERREIATWLSGGYSVLGRGNSQCTDFLVGAQTEERLGFREVRRGRRGRS